MIYCLITELPFQNCIMYTEINTYLQETESLPPWNSANLPHFCGSSRTVIPSWPHRAMRVLDTFHTNQSTSNFGTSLQCRIYRTKITHQIVKNMFDRCTFHIPASSYIRPTGLATFIYCHLYYLEFSLLWNVSNETRVMNWWVDAYMSEVNPEMKKPTGCRW